MVLILQRLWNKGWQRREEEGWMITIHALRSCSCSPVCSLLSFERRTHVLCEPEMKATWVSCRSAEWRLLFALPSTQSLINSRLIALIFDLTFICYKRAQKHLQEKLGNTLIHFKKGWGGGRFWWMWFDSTSDLYLWAAVCWMIPAVVCLSLLETRIDWEIRQLPVLVLTGTVMFECTGLPC